MCYTCGLLLHPYFWCVMHVYDKLDEADDILKQMEECGSFSLGHSPSDSSSEEQQGRERVEDEDKGFELLVKLKRIQLLLRLVFGFCSYSFFTLCGGVQGLADLCFHFLTQQRE